MKPLNRMLGRQAMRIGAISRRQREQAARSRSRSGRGSGSGSRLGFVHQQEPVGPYNIVENSNYGPGKVIHFSSLEERQAYNAEQQRQREAHYAYMRQMIEIQRRRDQEAAAAQAAAEAAENAATAEMNCIGRTCKRIAQAWEGTHTLSGTRKVKTEGGRRRRKTRHRGRK